MNRLKCGVVCVLGVTLATGCAVAQEAGGVSAITTERPSAGSGPDLIPGGSLQSESGFGFVMQRKGFAVDLPENLLRIGLTDRLELRAQSSNVVLEHEEEGFSPAKTTDFVLSAKVKLGRFNSYAPAAAIVSLSLPTGGEGLTTGSRDPGLALVWAQELPHHFLLVEVAQDTVSTLEGARKNWWTPSVSLGRAFNGRSSWFAEYAPGVLQDNRCIYVVDGGVLFTPAKFLQLDVRTGYLRDAAGSHALLTFGYSHRFDRFLGARSERR